MFCFNVTHLSALQSCAICNDHVASTTADLMHERSRTILLHRLKSLEMVLDLWISSGFNALVGNRSTWWDSMSTSIGTWPTIALFKVPCLDAAASLKVHYHAHARRTREYHEPPSARFKTSNLPRLVQSERRQDTDNAMGSISRYDRGQERGYYRGIYLFWGRKRTERKRCPTYLSP